MSFLKVRQDCSLFSDEKGFDFLFVCLYVLRSSLPVCWTVKFADCPDFFREGGHKNCGSRNRAGVKEAAG